ncbi:MULTISPECIES: hypothetical protein [unclassified Rathayibacter]|uniref:hypothetical protein n=1 Tax=unclassified Rathayibacter TaxID=2609250 RepID=UPI00188DB341|nr:MULTISPECIES: hypothetical protein [unclassified Rathayibacter]MBF4461505.1 hypothetical protein [Rathayibacter sp. VKM Ac-2879]MBF4502916.1 hypothetical protein [Rathayibacter sp. VKM Ac-2878]
MIHHSSDSPSSLVPNDDRLVSRRTVGTAAAWSVPAVAVALATPAAAASNVDVGAFLLTGSCGILGVLGPGFTLTASGTAPIPAGTTVTIIGSGVANIGVFSVTGGAASVIVLSGTGRQITVTAPLPAGATIAFRTTLSTSVAFRLNAVAELPEGYSGTGAKTAATVNSTLILCSAT